MTGTRRNRRVKSPREVSIELQSVGQPSTAVPPVSAGYYSSDDDVPTPVARHVSQQEVPVGMPQPRRQEFSAYSTQPSTSSSVDYPEPSTSRAQSTPLREGRFTEELRLRYGSSDEPGPVQEWQQQQQVLQVQAHVPSRPQRSAYNPRPSISTSQPRYDEIIRASPSRAPSINVPSPEQQCSNPMRIYENIQHTSEFLRKHLKTIKQLAQIEAQKLPEGDLKAVMENCPRLLKEATREISVKLLEIKLVRGRLFSRPENLQVQNEEILKRCKDIIILCSPMLRRFSAAVANMKPSWYTVLKIREKLLLVQVCACMHTVITEMGPYVSELSGIERLTFPIDIPEIEYATQYRPTSSETIVLRLLSPINWIMLAPIFFIFVYIYVQVSNN